MAYFPMFVQLKKKKCLVIGGGKIALRKIEVLKDFEADITVIAPEMITQIRQIDQICRIFRTFMEKDFNEADFVIAATDDQKTNHEISQICRRKKRKLKQSATVSLFTTPSRGPAPGMCLLSMTCSIPGPRWRPPARPSENTLK